MKPIAIDDFCAVRSLANVTFSPEGTSACFTVSQVKKEKNCYESRLYLLKGGRVRALTGGGKESSFCYLDENTVLFAGDREGEKEPSLTSRFYKIALDGGEADLAYTFPIPVSQVFPLKNGDLLVVGSTFPGFEDLYKGDRKLVKAYFDGKKENEDYEVISQLPWWWNGGTYTRGAYESLFYYDAKKKSLTRLTDAGFNVSDVQLAEDQKTVYFSLLDVSVPRPAHFGGQDLYRIDLASRRQELVVKSRPDFVIATYALGKSFLLVMAADGKFGMNTDCDFYKLDYETLAVTDRFRACASQRSISNWTSFYGVSDIGPDFSEDQCGSTIWPDVEKFWWHSPMKYADKVKTPTLFLHSLEDYRCPVDQGYQMYSALIAHGVESRLVLFRGENHELSRSGKPKHRIRRLNEITGWFEQHKG